jgi:hypothetical protein
MHEGERLAFALALARSDNAATVKKAKAHKLIVTSYPTAQARDAAG